MRSVGQRDEVGGSGWAEGISYETSPCGGDSPCLGTEGGGCPLPSSLGLMQMACPVWGWELGFTVGSPQPLHPCSFSGSPGGALLGQNPHPRVPGNGDRRSVVVQSQPVPSTA